MYEQYCVEIIVSPIRRIGSLTLVWFSGFSPPVAVGESRAQMLNPQSCWWDAACSPP